MYHRIGTYEGDIHALAGIAGALDVAWAPDGHGTTTDHVNRVREMFSPYVRDIPGRWAFSMLVALRPNGFVPLHRDVQDEYAGLDRYHLVLSTNRGCWNFHAGEWQQLEAGGIYRMDATQEHASINFGDAPRVHLVVDVVPSMVMA